MHVQCSVVGILQFLIGLDSYLVQTRLLFLLSQQLDFQYYFSLPGANYWVSLVSFSKLSFGRISLWTTTEVWLLVSLDLQETESGMPRNLNDSLSRQQRYGL